MRPELSLEIAEQALSFIDSNDRDIWVRMAFAMKNGFGDEGFAVWDRWSQTGATYKRKDAEICWRNAKALGRVTVGSLFHEAKANGWTGELPAPRKLSQKQRKEQMAKEKKEREKQEFFRKRAIERANKIFRGCEQKEHPYLASKGFEKVLGLVIPHKTVNMILKRKGFGGGPNSSEPFTEDPLVIPIRDANMQLVNVQLIFPNGDKHFLHGGEFKGFSHILNGMHNKNFILCEGYATGHSILHALWCIHRRDFSVGVCFSSWNMREVAGMSRKRVFIVADHDKEDKRGKRAGIESAKATGMPYWHPPKEGTDANDFYLDQGVEKLAAELRDFLKKHE